MKKLSILTGAAALLITLTLTACSGGFVDPGYKEIGVGTGGSSSGDLGGLGSTSGGNGVVAAKYQGKWEGNGVTVTVSGNSVSIPGQPSVNFNSHEGLEDGWDVYNISSGENKGVLWLRLTDSGTLQVGGGTPYDGTYTKVGGSNNNNNGGNGNDVIHAEYQGKWKHDESGAIITVTGRAAVIPGVGSISFDSYVGKSGDWDVYNVSSQGQRGTSGIRIIQSGKLEANGFGEYNGMYTRVN